MTSSPPSSRLSLAVLFEFPPLRAGNKQQGLRSLRDLTQHLTARADDSHASPVIVSLSKLAEGPTFIGLSLTCQAQVRFFALTRIKQHAPPLVRAPVNSFEFQPCDRTPQVGCLTISLRHRTLRPTPSTHRLGRGLPGYLILFATHAFAPERQVRARNLPSLLVFLPISTHSTVTPGIPVSHLFL